MFTDNTIHKINKNNPAEMDRNASKAYRVPLQFPVIACKWCLILLFWEKNSILPQQLSHDRSYISKT